MTKHSARTERQIARILALLAVEALSATEISPRLHMCITSVNRHINRLLEESPRRLCISAWRDGLHNKPVRIYCAGSCKDVRYVPRRERNPRDWRMVEADRKRAEVLALLAMPQTSQQLAGRMGVSISRVMGIIREHRAAGRVHIKAWVLPPAKGSQSPVYALGNAPDKVRARRSRERTPERRTAAWAPLVGVLCGSFGATQPAQVIDTAARVGSVAAAIYREAA